MVTLAPPVIGPELGLTLVTVGGGAASTRVETTAGNPTMIAAHQSIVLIAGNVNRSTPERSAGPN